MSVQARDARIPRTSVDNDDLASFLRDTGPLETSSTTSKRTFWSGSSLARPCLALTSILQDYALKHPFKVEAQELVDTALSPGAIQKKTLSGQKYLALQTGYRSNSLPGSTLIAKGPDTRDRKTRSESSARSLESLSLPSIKTHTPIIVTDSDQMELSSLTFGHDSTGVLLELPAGPTSPRPLQSHPSYAKCTDKPSEPLVKATVSDNQPPSPTRNWFLDLHNFPGSDFAANQTRPLDRSEVYLESRRYGDTTPPVLPRETAKRPIVPNRKIRKRQTTTSSSRSATPRDSGIATPSTGRSTPDVVNRMSPNKGLLYTICAAPATPPMSRHGSQDSGSSSPSFDLYPATVKIPSRQERARLSDRTSPSESESDQAPNKALPALPADAPTPRAAAVRLTPRRMSPHSSRPSIEVPSDSDTRRTNTPSPLPRPRTSHTVKPAQSTASPWEYSKDLLLESLASLDTAATEEAIEKLRMQVQARKLQNSQGDFAKCLIGPTSALDSGHAQGSLLVGLQNEALRKENARLRAALHIFMVNS